MFMFLTKNKRLHEYNYGLAYVMANIVCNLQVNVNLVTLQMKLPTMVQVGSAMESERRMLVLGLLGCGVLAAGVVAAAAFLLIRRHAKSRDKLQSLSQPDQEASKDYQVSTYFVVKQL
jgi:hypothetical protein